MARPLIIAIALVFAASLVAHSMKPPPALTLSDEATSPLHLHLKMNVHGLPVDQIPLP